MGAWGKYGDGANIGRTNGLNRSIQRNNSWGNSWKPRVSGIDVHSDPRFMAPRVSGIDVNSDPRFMAPKGGSQDTPPGGGDGGKKTGSVYGAAFGYKSNPYLDYFGFRNNLAQKAHDDSMAALDNAYGAYLAALEENLNSTKSTLNDAYSRSKDSIMADARQSLKQAYINKMLQSKNFDQEMSAQGISGGASETTRAAMSNNYGNARNNINTTTNSNLSALEGNYNENLANAMQAYNSAVAQAQLAKAQQQMELDNALANGQIAALDDFYSMMGDNTDQFYAALGTAIDGANGFEWNPTEVTNTYIPPEVLQANTMDQRTYANLLQALQAIMAQGGQGNPAMNQYIAAMRNALA